MVKRLEAVADRISGNEVAKILADTAHAVKIMKASWLRVALNLQKIRKHELWRETSPPCSSYEDYAYGVLKLNRAVERRMVSAMEYTEERRPSLLERFQQGGDEVEIPSYDVVNQLRRVEEEFKDRPEDWKSLETMVFDEGAGRVVLRREIDERLGQGDPSPPPRAEQDSLELVRRDLKAIEARLRKLKAPKQSLKLCFELVEALEKQGSKEAPAEPSPEPNSAPGDPAAQAGGTGTDETAPPW